jgi:alpha/beta superfamily hydrolase
MFNNVVDAVQGSLAGTGFSTLRFNFRGAGGSKGEYGDGALEVEDIRGAAAFIAQEVDGPLYLAGYSFGAYVGLSGVVSDDRVKALVCISPPLAMYNFTALRDEGRPKLIVAGERDFICPVTELEALFFSLSPPKVLHIVPGADHFWWGIEDRVADYVIDFLQGL